MVLTLPAVVLSLLLFQAADAEVAGVVTDSTGASVAGALVTLRSEAGAESQSVTGPDGAFAFDQAPQAGTILVKAAGFAVYEAAIDARVELRIVLVPASFLETVTVTPTRTEQRVGDMPASVSVLTSDDIRQSPAVVADDVLRQAPTFSLFRRTSSLSSHPTSQGVSLRGIGPSGVSRTLVLFDGVPFNDAFGGWVYWTRIPLDRADRIEIVDGSSSNLYGNFAMGGVINVVSTQPARRTFEIRPLVGNNDSRKVDVYASDVWGRVGTAVDGSAFTTDGFPIVAANERGKVDTKAAVRYRNINGRLDVAVTERARIFVRGGYFWERRNNGKASTFDGTPEKNDTTWKTFSAGARVLLPDSSNLQAHLFADWERFHSNFLAVPAPNAANPVPRSVGRMTLNQTVPTKSLGGMVTWSRMIGAMQSVTAGGDWRWVRGDSEEDGLDDTIGQTVTLRRVSGGKQRSAGVFLQDIVTPTSNVVITAGARVDRWRNYDSHNLENSVPSGTPTSGHRPSLADRSETVVSPRLAALYKVSRQVSAWGSISAGFRAPTLNELYRQFRVGTVLTLANDMLGPERLKGGEAGVTIAFTPAISMRATWFDNRIRNPVSNVTIATTPPPTTQQRQNLGRTRIWGVQTELDVRLAESWRIGGGYVYDEATVREYQANPAIVGKFLPQVPKHRGSVQASYTHPRVATISLGLQAIGTQFDDDANSRSVPGRSRPGLPKYAIVDVNVLRAVGRNLDLFFGVQNVLNTTYYVGTLPTTVGSPRLLTGGARLRLTGR